MKFSLILILTLFLCSLVEGSWGSGCSVAVAAPLPQYRWVLHKNPDQRCLLKDDKQVGVWVKSEGKYYPLDRNSDTWLPPASPPIKPPGCECCQACECRDPCPCRESAKPCDKNCLCVTQSGRFGVFHEDLLKNPGVDVEKWKSDPLPHERKVEGDPVPRDKDLLRITVIGPKEKRDQVVTDLSSHPLLSQFKGSYVLYAQEPEHFQFAGLGFVTGGGPTIYFQSPTGKVLHRQDSYRGPEKLAEALRRIRPDYDPAKDFDLNSSVGELVRYWPFLLVGGVVLFLLWKKNDA